jgi:hypothetical protein
MEDMDKVLMAIAVQRRPIEESKTSVIMKNVSAKWTKMQDGETLKSISLSMKGGGFVQLLDQLDLERYIICHGVQVKFICKQLSNMFHFLELTIKLYSW